MEKKERREHKIITENRQATLDKRETSWQQLADKLENGEDGIYNISNHARGKAVLLQPKVSITKQDLEEIPDLKQLRDAINSVEKQAKKSSGYTKYKLYKQLIEMRKSQYIIKDAYRKPLYPTKLIHTKHSLEMKENVFLDSDEKVHGFGITLLNINVINSILNNYKKLKDESKDKINDDIWYVLYDFDSVYKDAMRDYPIYRKIVELKIDGYQNIEIQQEINKLFNVNYSPEYISSIWRKRIPKIIIAEEEKRFLSYYYLNIEKGHYKKCGKCGQIKLAHNKYFSLNKESGDGYYSICKQCRNKKKR